MLSQRKVEITPVHRDSVLYAYSPREQAVRSGSPRRPILVVEDDPAIRETLRSVLEDEGYAVEEAADGAAALALVHEREPALIVLDIGLPIVDGYGVAAGVRERFGDGLPIIVVTAAGRASEAARRIGATSYLSKPFDLDDFLAHVERAWHGA